jgi:hypothetical protein
MVFGLMIRTCKRGRSVTTMINEAEDNGANRAAYPDRKWSLRSDVSTAGERKVSRRTRPQRAKCVSNRHRKLSGSDERIAFAMHPQGTPEGRCLERSERQGIEALWKCPVSTLKLKC